MMSVIIDFVTNIGLEAVKEKISDSVNEKKVRERLVDYLKRQQALNFDVSKSEEIDFGGLSMYICSNLMGDVKLRLWGSREERGNARQRIIEKSVAFSMANTRISSKRTQKIVGTAVDILRSYYRSKVNKDLLFIAGEIEDTIHSEQRETRNLIESQFEHLNATILTTTGLSVDNSLSKIHSGQLNQVETQLGTYINAISAEHSLFPNYGFRMTTDNKLVSFPLTAEAKKRYPENFRISVSSVQLGDQPVHTIDKTIFYHSYCHQLPIYINIQNARKYLGDVLDPIQAEAEELIGTQAIMNPPAFPPAFPCKVSIGQDFEVPFLLLRTKEILDDGSIIITNDEQNNFNFSVSIRLIPSTQKLTFTITPCNPSNQECLYYRLCLKQIMSGKTITVYALNLNEQIIQGTVENKDIRNLDKEIDFLQKILTIEKYFNRTIEIPESITPADHAIINRICALIQNSYSGELYKIEFSFDLTEELRQSLSGLKNTDYILKYSAIDILTLFNQEFHLPITREIECVTLEEPNRLKKKLSVLDVGDQIKIMFIPGQNRNKCRYTDIISVENTENNSVSIHQDN